MKERILERKDKWNDKRKDEWHDKRRDEWKKEWLKEWIDGIKAKGNKVG